MMKRCKAGLGKYVYTEWMIPVRDYYGSIRKNEVAFEIIFPAVCAIGGTFWYYRIGKLFAALDGLSDLLPTAISILIGFTIMLITLLLTGNGENMNKLKTTMSHKLLYGKKVNIFQGLHIQFTHSLFSEIVLLLLVFAYLFWSGIGMFVKVAVIFLTIEIYLILNILLSILRGVTSLYFSFYHGE